MTDCTGRRKVGQRPRGGQDHNLVAIIANVLITLSLTIYIAEYNGVFRFFFFLSTITVF